MVAGNDKNKKVTDKWFVPFCAVFICITSIALYHKSEKNDFLDLDDMTLIVKNYSFLEDFSNAGQAFKQGVFQVPGEQDTLASFYRPMMTLSFMLDAHISPKTSRFPVPAPFITANIFYHTLACILLFFLLLYLRIPHTPSFLLPLIFTVHPLLNQAIAWIPGRNDSLLTIFILSSFLFLLKYLQTKKSWCLILHVFFFLMALFTKENAVVLIPIVFIYLRFVNKEQLSGKQYISLGIYYLICIIPWFTLRHIALASNADGSTLTDITHTMFSNAPFFIQYVSKSVLPFNLSVMTTTADTNYIVGLLAIALLSVGIFMSKKKNLAFVVFGFCWFLLFLSPSFISSFSGIEHRAYLPLVGIIFMASDIDIIKAADYKNKSIQSRMGIIMLASIFLLFYYVSYRRLPIFQNRYTFDESAMQTSPHSTLPCVYLAAHYDEEALYDKAINAYKEAMKRDSSYNLSYLNMAGDYLRLNDYKDAESILKLAIHENPPNSVAIFNLGLVVFQYEHKDSLGVSLWKKAIAIDSAFARPYKVLSQYYQAVGDNNDAILYRNFYIRKSVR